SAPEWLNFSKSSNSHRLPSVHHKVKRVGMALVSGMMFPRYFNPVVGIILWKENVTIDYGVYFRKVHALGDIKRLTEDSCTADNENFFFLSLPGFGERAVNGVNNNTTRSLVIALMGDYDICAVG